jgi:hypothetical protein
MVEEQYNPGWDEAAAPARPYAGLAGFSASGKNILSDTEGFFGFSVLKATNLIFDVRTPAGSTTDIRDLLLSISYPGQPGGQPELITYSPAYVYERTVPEGADITVATSGGRYVATQQVLQVPGGTVKTVIIQLQFVQGYALHQVFPWA